MFPLTLQSTAVSWEGFNEELDRVTSTIEDAERRLNNQDCTFPQVHEKAVIQLKIFKVCEKTC